MANLKYQQMSTTGADVIAVRKALGKSPQTERILNECILSFSLQLLNQILEEFVHNLPMFHLRNFWETARVSNGNFLL